MPSALVRWKSNQKSDETIEILLSRRIELNHFRRFFQLFKLQPHVRREGPGTTPSVVECEVESPITAADSEKR